MPVVLRAAVLAVLALLTQPASARAADDPGGDGARFDNTMAVPGRTFSANCSGCHNVQARRAMPGGDVHAAIVFDDTMAALGSAVAGLSRGRRG